MTSAYDLDHGVGDATWYEAADLERLYRSGGLDPKMRILGEALNQILGVTRYKATRWYVVTSTGVKRL